MLALRRTPLFLLIFMLMFTMMLPSQSVTFAKGDTGSGVIQVKSLTTEYAKNPLGIDVKHPRLSWKLKSHKRDQIQTAYRILVASSKKKLENNIADIWDSGKVKSDQSVNLVYQGPALKSSHRYYWKVRVWDKNGNPSSWSDVAWWEMGLLKPSDWKAEWIGHKSVGNKEKLTLDDASWIWYPEGNPGDAPEGSRYFRLTFDLPMDSQFTGAHFLLTADDGYVLYVNGKKLDSSPVVTNAWQKARLVDLSSALNPGKNVIAVVGTNRKGPEVNPAGLIGKLRIKFENRKPLVFVTNKNWKTNKIKESGWKTSAFNDSDWVNAQEIASYGEQPWGDRVKLPESSGNPSPLFRKEFIAKKEIKQARVYISGLGYYELYINGKRVGDHVLDPALTDYEKTVLYETYDVTDLLKQKNVIGVALGRGRYGEPTPNVWFWDKAPWHSDPELLLKLQIDFTDGTSKTIVSNGTWKVVDGPTRFDSLYAGETYDARKEKPGWKKFGYDDSDWGKAEIVEGPAGELKSQMMQPIKVTDTIKPVEIAEPEPGVYVYDMGQMIAGWVQLKVQGPAGTKVQLVYGEKLHDDGTVNVDQGNIYAQMQTDKYILKGDGVETWEPRFSYKGFRYVQVTGFPGTPTLDNITGKVVHTAVGSAGSFHSSNSLINQIHENTRWALLNNFHGIPTDTPVYEKNGWTGDAQLTSGTSMYNFHMARFYTKWLNDFSDAQRPSGEIPDIVPTSDWSYSGEPGWAAVHGPTPAWDAAYFIIPWGMYKRYGDTRILAKQYSHLKRYLDYLSSKADGYIYRDGLGDYLSPGVNAPEGPAIVATGYYYRMTEILSKIAKVLGHPEDFSKYSQLATNIKEAFNANFFEKDRNVYHTNRDVGYRQTSNIIPLAFNLVPKGHEKEVVANIVADVKKRDNHLNTGFFGTRFLLPVLTEYGYGDLAYKVATQKTYPSWGYWIVNGATALYEHWELNSRSRDHHMFGSIDQWFYQYLAGIKSIASGGKKIKIQPNVVGDLTNARAFTETPLGKVGSSWKLNEQGTFKINVQIPVNATAMVYVPADSKWNVMESGQLALMEKGIQFVRMEDGHAVFEVGSGNYHFVSYPASAAHMNTLVQYFEESGAFVNHGAARSLQARLDTVIHFREKGSVDKVVKHMGDFKRLLGQQKEQGLISKKAYAVLKAEMLSFVNTFFEVKTALKPSSKGISPGDTFNIKAILRNTGEVNVDDVHFSLNVPEGWSVTSQDVVQSGPVQPGENVTETFRIMVPKDQELTDEANIKGKAVYQKFGEEATVPLQTTVKVVSPIRIQTRVDPVELGEETMLHITLQNIAQQSFSGNVSIDAPPDWTANPEMQSYQLRGGEKKSLGFMISVPGTAEHGADFHVTVTYGTHVTEKTIRVYLPAVSWEFETTGDAEGWRPANDLTNFTVSGGILKTQSTGGDPYMIEQNPLLLDASHGAVIELTMKTSESGSAQIFWATEASPNFSEGKSTHFDVKGGEFHVYDVLISPQNSDVIQLRLDPMEQAGDVTIKSIRILR